MDANELGSARGRGAAGKGLGVVLVVVLVVALAFAAIAVGTVHEWSRGVVFALSALGCLLAIGQRLSERKPAVLTLPHIALGLAVVATALQLVPLPAGVLARLSPAADEIL